MAKAAKKSSTNIVATHATSCPVVELAQQLTDLWDADEGCENNQPKRWSSEIMGQLSSWRAGIVEIISFTQAKGLAGAIVQMSLAMDELETMSSQDAECLPGYRSRIERLIGSAARVIKSSMGSSDCQVVEATLQANGLRYLTGGDCLSSLETWQKQGRAIRRKRFASTAEDRLTA